MNIFKKKLEQTQSVKLPIEPTKLYESLFPQEGYEYLRAVQEEVLTSWHSVRDQHDVVVKMNTGSGKTLTGLLMLYSKLIEGTGTSLYVCPDNQLVEQTIEQAKLYRIPVCQFDKDDKNFPPDFINKKSILVCNFHKLFNGKSVFKRHNIQIGSLILDDAHTCVDIARDVATISLPINHELRQRLLGLFEDSLKFQNPATFHRMYQGDPTINVRVPYWAWMDKHIDIIRIINEYSADDNIKFKWDIVSENLLSYDCFFSGNRLEIAPIHVPYHEISSFAEATHRFILSATFEDDMDFIKDLGIDRTSIENPIVPKDRKDVGQRLLLAPSRYNSDIKNDDVRNFVSKYKNQDINTVVLVSSSADAKVWGKVGATIIDKKNIKEAIHNLKTTKGNFMVFLNRYDGLDLSADMCRVLVIDGLPAFSTLKERYMEVRLESLIHAKRGQIIEQGLGRAVRSGSDFCTVYLIGNDLITFLGYNDNLKYFTPITRAQIDLGLKLLDEEDTSDTLGLIAETASLCLNQDKEWRAYHAQAISAVEQDHIDSFKVRKYKIAESETKALAKFKTRSYKEASKIISDEILKNESLELNEKEKAWYFQLAAQMLYLEDKPASNDLQVKSFSITSRMFQPQHGKVYSRLSNFSKQAALVKDNISNFTRPQDLVIFIEQIISELQYHPDIPFKKFESRLAELGEFLGFKVQQPENEVGNGPDVLWCMTNNYYLILEAKSNATHDYITRDNVEQVLHSIEWFKSIYGDNIDYVGVTLQSTNKKEKNAVSNNIKVLDQSSLVSLHTNLRSFVGALQTDRTNEHSIVKITELLQAYKLTPDHFLTGYLRNVN